jgi:hypothetical protein
MREVQNRETRRSYSFEGLDKKLTSTSADAGDARHQVRNGSQAASRNVVTCGSPVTPVGGNSPRPG